jgi:hypothetical protein
MTKRDEFPKGIIDSLAKRAFYTCSNPGCRCLTLSPSEEDDEKYISIGVAAHITAAAEGGPRYDASLSPEERYSIKNGIFLCSNCASMIDKNNGLDYSTELLKRWKEEHKKWARENLNKSGSRPFTIVDGEHRAEGIGKVTGLDIGGPAVMRPGTKSTARGIGEVTGTRIGQKGDDNK